MEVDGVSSRTASDVCCSSTRSDVGAALCKVEVRPINVASESVGVATAGTCRVGCKTGAFSSDGFFVGWSGLVVRIGLVGTSGMDSERVVFLLRAGERAPVDDVRVLVSEREGLVGLVFDTRDSSVLISAKIS